MVDILTNTLGKEPLIYTLRVTENEPEETITFYINDGKYTKVECQIDTVVENNSLFIREIRQVDKEDKVPASLLLSIIADLNPSIQTFEGNSVSKAKMFWQKLGAEFLNLTHTFRLPVPKLQSYIVAKEQTGKTRKQDIQMSKSALKYNETWLTK